MLATKKTLVQELYCIETLARVDTLCLDKTGTITEGTMCVDSVKLYKTEKDSERIAEETEVAENTESTEQISEEDQAALKNVDYVMGNLMNVLTDQNATADALRQRFPVRKDMKPVHAIPFSSDRKYSGAVFEGQGTYLMGAVQFLFPEGNEQLTAACAGYAQSGMRVLVLAHSEQQAQEMKLPEGLQPIAFILITDVIRQEAPDTLAFFDSQGVDLKVISGAVSYTHLTLPTN